MAELLWKPSEEQIKKTNMYRFMNFINERFGKDFQEYAPLHQWSIDNISDFWAAFWEFAEVISTQSLTIRWWMMTPKCRGPNGFRAPGLILPKICFATAMIKSH
ncbi:MAG: hypothetical protein GWN67_18530 [Phycisphaerae bacterium]|nr:hypothetical protein [Phycisphaerae bacterium]NIW94571.1 hypothetical protein [Phycisphaerae bacterium]